MVLAFPLGMFWITVLIIFSIIFFAPIPLFTNEKTSKTLCQFMGSAHALKGIHTGRNPVFCLKGNHFKCLSVFGEDVSEFHSVKQMKNKLITTLNQEGFSFNK